MIACLFVFSRFSSCCYYDRSVWFGCYGWGGGGVGGCYGGVCSINLYSLVAVQVILICRLRFRVINIPKFMISVKL